MKGPELLLPAGSNEHMRRAFQFGADAVYAGQPRYSLRVRDNEYSTIETLEEGIRFAHGEGKRFYLAVNILAHNSKVKTFLRDMGAVVSLGPDALIMSDVGLIMLTKEAFPEMEIHLSVQANTVNFAAVKFWKSVGISRVILSRELSIEEIAEIRERCPDVELEVFVHGAICIAYSGRCLLSGYFNHRDANQGACTNACRWKYDLLEKTAISTVENRPIHDRVSGGDFYLRESNRPGDMMPIEEDEHGTYIMNAKDLRAVEEVEKLVKIGVDCLKVEGRTKSVYYVARTAQVYRAAIDDAVSNRPFNPNLIGELDALANRGYTSGFLSRHHSKEYQNYIQGFSKSEKSILVGEVIEWIDNVALIKVKNKFQLGDTLEVIAPDSSLNHQFKLETLLDKRDRPIQIAKGDGFTVKIPTDVDVSNAFISRLLRIGNVSE